jgi:hypothetical protein
MTMIGLWLMMMGGWRGGFALAVVGCMIGLTIERSA